MMIYYAIGTTIKLCYYSFECLSDKKNRYPAENSKQKRWFVEVIVNYCVFETGIPNFHAIFICFCLGYLHPGRSR